MIKYYLQTILLKLLPIEFIIKSISELKIQRCIAWVTIGNASKFYEEAKVFNLGQDKALIVIGDDTHIRGELLTFANGGKIKIGSNCYIGEGSRIWSADEIVIGDNVLISHNCNIIDTNSHEMDYLERAEGYRNIIKKGHTKEKNNVLHNSILIDDYAWISYNVSILKGVKIGKGAIIGAGSVVTKDVPEFTIATGNPAIHIRKMK